MRNTLYVGKEGCLHRLHPLTKLVTIACLVLLAFSCSGGLLALGVLLLILLLALAGGVMQPLISALLRTVLPIMLSLFLLDGLLYHDDGHVLLRVGFISIKEEGLMAAAAMCARLLLAFTAALLLLLTTHPARLARALSDKGIPQWVGHILLAAFQMIPETAARAQAIVDAQRTRGLCISRGSFFSRLRALPPLLAPLLLSTLSDVEEQAMALEARGFNRSGPRTSLQVTHEMSWEPFLRWSMVLATAVAVAHLRGWF